MSNKRLRAVVRVVLEVESDSVWSDSTTFEQVSKQACDDVRGLLLNGNLITLGQLPRRIKSLETVEVIVMLEAQK